MEQLRRLRAKKGVTQTDVASALGIDRTTYAKYESGASAPNVDMLGSLATYYGVTVDFLLDRTVTSEAQTSSSAESLPKYAGVPLPKSAASQLSELRTQNGYSQSKLAAMLHVNQAAVSQWECGATSPSKTTLAKLCEIYDITPDYFYVAEQKAPTPVAEDGRSELDWEIMSLSQPLSDDQKKAVIALLNSMQPSPESSE